MTQALTYKMLNGSSIISHLLPSPEREEWSSFDQLRYYFFSQSNKDWPVVFRTGFVLFWFTLSLCSFYLTLAYLKEQYRQCKRHNRRREQLGRRQILARLLEAKTPADAWYDIKMLGLRDGVHVSEEQEKETPKWSGFRQASGKEEVARSLKVVWAMGRSSLVRELRDEDRMEEWFEKLQAVEVELLDMDGLLGEPPAYSP